MKHVKTNMHAAQLKRMKGQRPVTTTHRIPGRPYQPGEEDWYARADAQAARFVREQRAALYPLPTVEMALRVCADFVWEYRQGEPAWEHLPINYLWQRLALQDALFPQPHLVLAFHDGLQRFLPWLVTQGALSEGACQVQLAELARVKSPLFETACAMLREPVGAPS